MSARAQLGRLHGPTLSPPHGGVAEVRQSSRRSQLRTARRLAPIAFVISDLCAVALAFFAAALSAAWISEAIIGREFLLLSEPGRVVPRLLEYVMVSALLLVLLASRGSYRLRQPFWEELRAILIGVTVVALVDGFFQYASKDQFSRLWLIQNWVLAGILLLLGRAAMRRLLEGLGLWRLPTLVVGSGANAREVIAALRAQAHLGYRIVGHADVDAGHFVPAAPGAATRLDGGGQERVEPLLALIDRLGIDSVVLSFDAVDVSQNQQLFRELTKRRVAYSVAPPLRGMTVLGVEAQHFFGHDVVLLRTRNNLDRPFDRALKRLFDLAAGSLLLFLLGPLMLTLTLLVKLDGGPAFYGHKRVGRHGRPFRCLKFRSMAPNAEQLLCDLLERDAELAAEWARDFKLRDDPRVTRLGRFLRKSSLDELPQLFNVLRGEMSLVGPRPIVEAELPLYGDDADYYLETQPGITGLWQISGRNDVAYERRVAMDAWYVRNWSIWHDVAILFRTLPAVVKRSGVY